MIFIVVMEAINKLLSKAREVDLFKGWCVKRGEER